MFVFGCGAVTPTSPLTIDTGQLGGSWTLRSIQRVGESEQAAPAGTAYTLTFTDDRVSTRADCNICNGGFTVSGARLTIGPALACTRAACPTMAFESAYTSILAGESTAAVSAGGLTLTSSRGVVRFTR